MQQYLKKNNFKLVERSGESLFILSKTHGDLQVNILCDARQVYMDEDRFEEELEENAEESVDGDAKHDLEKDDMEDGEEEDQPVLLRIEVINKANQKLTFDATLGQENVSINSLHATPADVEAPAEIPIMAVGTRKNAAFTGPNFLDLSEDMQESFNNYLVALGVDGSLFEALREHLTTKEHSEYVSWLNNVKNFISTK